MTEHKMQSGKLFLIPAPLSENEPQWVLPQKVIDTIHALDYFIVEELRTARRFLKKINYPKNFDNIQFSILNEHTPSTEISELITPCLQGFDTGLLSEAGCPCIADPGAAITSLAHHHHIRVIPLTGPSSILLALIASGLNGQNFAFEGYLPIDKKLKIKRLKELEKNAWQHNQTHIFIEAPYRNLHLFQDILEHCQPNTLLCIACNVTAANEYIKTLTVKDWKKNNPPIHKENTVFLIGRQQ